VTLAAGTQFGRYQIHARIGAGGMGEVYRAVDTDLKREVALKMLPAAVTAEPDRLARFQREAEILASLNHPNIAVLYGVETADSARALVMELVGGSDLSDRIARGPIAPAQALVFARQIAEAVEAAHQAGVIHRDLKPSNVKVRGDGTIKVLDFGLAKALEPTSNGEDTSHIPTRGETKAGVILGTAAYMSPEQARGLPVDQRTDIWAFGCVLFEMLSGRSAFGRETFSDSLAAVLEREPPWAALPATTPPAIRRLLGRCLTKDQYRRLRDIGDARLDIDDAIVSPLADLPPAAEHRRHLMRRWMVALLTTVAVGAVAWATWPQRAVDTASSGAFPVRFSIAGPPSGEIDISRSPIGISRDGRAIAFAARRGATQQIFVRELNAPDAAALPGTEGGFAPFFSPDGNWVRFFANQKVRKVLRSGGSPVAIADFKELGATRNVSASWDEQDAILFTPDVNTGIWRVPASGGTPTVVTKPKSTETFHLWPQLLPGGGSLLFSASDDGPDPQAYVQRLDTGERKALVRGHGTRYVPSGHLVFVQGGSLMAVPFDLQRLEITGPAIGVVSDVTAPFRLRTMPMSFNRLFDVSPAGTLAFVSAGRAPEHALVWVDRAGNDQPVGASGGTYAQPRLSPDGRRIAVVVRGDDFHDVWLYEPGRNTWNRFTSGGNSEFPVWTLDGTRVVYNSDRSGAVAIEMKRSDGSGTVETLVSGQWARRSFPFSWSPDGLLAFVAVRPAQDIFTVRPGSGADPAPFVATPFVEGGPAFAPDGRAIAYVSAETGRNEIYVRTFPGDGEKVTVSNGGGNEPVWSPTGRELFYRVGDAMMAVDVTISPRLTIATPRRLFEKHYEPSVSLYANYSTIDGQRFVMVKRLDQRDAPVRIDVTVNWFELLKRATQ